LTPAPEGVGDLGRRLDLVLEAGVVEGHVEAPERVDRLLQRGLHVLRRRHVAAHGQRSPAGLLDHAGRLLTGCARSSRAFRPLVSIASAHRRPGAAAARPLFDASAEAPRDGHAEVESRADDDD
jgi:hypothetical protein